MKKLINMEHDRVRKLQVLEAAGFDEEAKEEEDAVGSGVSSSSGAAGRPPMLYANNICTFSVRPRASAATRGGRGGRRKASTRINAFSVEEEVDEERLRAKLERNEVRGGGEGLKEERKGRVCCCWGALFVAWKKRRR